MIILIEEISIMLCMKKLNYMYLVLFNANKRRLKILYEEALRKDIKCRLIYSLTIFKHVVFKVLYLYRLAALCSIRCCNF